MLHHLYYWKEHQMLVVKSSIRGEDSFNSVSSDPGVPSVLVLVVVVGVGGAQCLHFRPTFSFTLKITNQVVSCLLYGFQSLPSHWQFGTENRSLVNIHLLASVAIILTSRSFLFP